MIKPLRDNVVIRKLKEEETKSGIIIPSTTKDKPQFAEVVAVGSGTKDIQMHVQEGDKVLFSKYAGIGMKVENEELTMIKQADIIAIVER